MLSRKVAFLDSAGGVLLIPTLSFAQINPESLPLLGESERSARSPHRRPGLNTCEPPRARI